MDNQKELEKSLIEQQAQLAALQASRPSKQEVDSLLEKYNTKVATAEEVALQQAMEAIGQNLQRIGQSLADINAAKAEVVDIKKALETSMGEIANDVSMSKDNREKAAAIARNIEAKAEKIEGITERIMNDEIVFQDDLEDLKKNIQPSKVGHTSIFAITALIGLSSGFLGAVLTRFVF